MTEHEFTKTMVYLSEAKGFEVNPMMLSHAYRILTTPPRAEQEGKEVIDIVFKKLNEWAYNETNEAGTKLIVIDASDLPEIKTEIMGEITRRSQPTP